MHHLWNIQWNENGLFTGTINAGRCTEVQNGQDDYNLKSLKEYLLLRIIINYYSINNIFLGLCVFACMDKYALYFNFLNIFKFILWRIFYIVYCIIKKNIMHYLFMYYVLLKKKEKD